MRRAFAAHCAKLRAEPSVYGAIGLSELFEMREECLREFGFSDVYRRVGKCDSVT
jgi:type II pantothenate kinase